GRIELSPAEAVQLLVRPPESSEVRQGVYPPAVAGEIAAGLAIECTLAVGIEIGEAERDDRVVHLRPELPLTPDEVRTRRRRQRKHALLERLRVQVRAGRLEPFEDLQKGVVRDVVVGRTAVAA